MACAACGVRQTQGGVAELIDMGTPTDGVRKMEGYRAFVLRVNVSPRLWLRFINLRDNGDGIVGGLAQRWTDPGGRAQYTVTSPGPLAADGTWPTDRNFDTHLLIDPCASEYSRVSESGQEFLTDINPIPSTPFVGYGSSVVPVTRNRYAEPDQALHGVIRFDAASAVETSYIAYIVTSSMFTVHVSVGYYNASFIYCTSVSGFIPEPSGAPAAAVAATVALRRRRRAGEGHHPIT